MAPCKCWLRRCWPSVAGYVEAHAEEVDADGHRLVVRNGYQEPREVMTAAGAVTVREVHRFERPLRRTSATAPPGSLL